MKNKGIYIDDAGCGFPLGGTIFGIYNNIDEQFSFIEVPVSFFQSPLFERKLYLKESANRIVEFFKSHNCLPSSFPGQIYVCPGYVNNGIANILNSEGFRVIRTKIGEPLQSRLESVYADYIRKLTGQDFYYDPKLLRKNQIGRAFYKVIKWARTNNRFDIAKTGWKYFKKNSSKEVFYG